MPVGMIPPTRAATRVVVYFFRRTIQQQILWLAFSHHIMELFVKAAYHVIFGETKSTDVKLFSFLNDPATWNSLKLDYFRPPVIPKAYMGNCTPSLSLKLQYVLSF